MRKTLFFFLILTVVAAAIYARQAGFSVMNEDFWFWMPLVALAATWAMIVYLFFRLIRPRHWINQENDNGLRLMEGGKLAEASAVFQRLSDLYPRNFVFKNNLAAVNTRMGRFDRALRVLTEASGLKQPANRYIVPCSFAHVHALASELDVAEQAYDTAFEATPAERDGMLALPRAFIALRRGAYKIVAEFPEKEWFEAESCGAASHLRRLRLLRAYALSKLPATETSHAEINDMLAGARPFHPGEYDYLTVRLPDLKNFLMEHEFTPAPAEFSPQRREDAKTAQSI